MYEASDSTNPKIYALESGSLKFRFLSNSFSGYLRMAIAHMGLPYWELCFTNCNLPSWTEVKLDFSVYGILTTLELTSCIGIPLTNRIVYVFPAIVFITCSTFVRKIRII